MLRAEVDPKAFAATKRCSVTELPSGDPVVDCSVVEYLTGSRKDASSNSAYGVHFEIRSVLLALFVLSTNECV